MLQHEKPTLAAAISAARAASSAAKIARSSSDMAYSFPSISESCIPVEPADTPFTFDLVSVLFSILYWLMFTFLLFGGGAPCVVRRGGFPKPRRNLLLEDSMALDCLNNFSPPLDAFCLRNTSIHTFTSWLATARISRLVCRHTFSLTVFPIPTYC